MRLLRVPYRLLFPCIVVLCCVGAYSVNASTFLILMMAGFALLGYIFGKLGCEGAPFLLGFVLGPLMEENFRRSMVLSFGDPMIFLQPPDLAVHPAREPGVDHADRHSAIADATRRGVPGITAFGSKRCPKASGGASRCTNGRKRP